MNMNSPKGTTPYSASPPHGSPATWSSSEKALYSGTWTPEEQEYLEALCHRFHEGTLDLPPTTTLRSYLGEMLGCNPKRISKRMENTDYNGRSHFQDKRQLLSPEETKELKKKDAELQELRRAFLASREALPKPGFVTVEEKKPSTRKSKSALAKKKVKMNAHTDVSGRSQDTDPPAVAPNMTADTLAGRTSNNDRLAGLLSDSRLLAQVLNSIRAPAWTAAPSTVTSPTIQENLLLLDLLRRQLPRQPPLPPTRMHSVLAMAQAPTVNSNVELQLLLQLLLIGRR